MKATFKMPQNKLCAKFNMNVTPDIRIFATKAELQIETDNRISGDNQLGNRINLTEEDILNLSVTVNNNYAVLDDKFTSIYETITNYGDIVSYDAADFATANQGLLAESALQPNDNISLLNNNAGFITNAVNDLTNYYLKSETYTKTEVQQLIASIPKFTVVVVQALPVAGQPMTLYLLAKDGEAPDVYEEYIWVTETETYELIGSTAVDLDGYATEDWVEAKGYATETFVNNGLSTKQNTLTAGQNININGNTISATDTTYTAGTGISIENNVISNTQTSTEWGNIDGDITEQTDLIELLDGKQDLLTSENAGDNISIEGGAEEKTVSGNGFITLTDAIEDSLTDVTVSGGTVGLALPLGYTLVDGITNTSTGTKLNTDIVADTTALEMEVRVKPSTGSWYIFQSRSSSEGITGIGGATNGSTIAGYYLGTSVTSAITRDTSHIYFVKLTLNNGNMTLYVKDETSNTEDTVTDTYDTTDVPTEPLYLWGNSQNTVGANNTIYMARLKKNGVTVLDYISCIYNETAGFYDTASRSFKTKTSASGAIVAGDVLPIPSPSPTNPNYLVCNNGNISCSRNMFKTTGTSTTAGGTIFTVQDDGSVVCSGTATSYSSWIMGRAYVTPNMGEVTVSIDGVYGSPGNITVDRCQLMNSSGTALTSISWSTWTKSVTVDLSEYPTASYIQVSLKRSSNGAVNATIKAQVIKGSTIPTWKPFGQVSINTSLVETITDESGNTATAETLLGIGDYTDTQEVLSGTVTRKVGILALTGTESWSGNSSNPYFSLAKSAISPTPIATSYAPLCTHLVGANTYESVAGTIFFGTSYLNVNYNNEGGGSSSGARANFNNWLREQYGNGTPVILVYPLAEETTESVTAQTLEVEEGNNTIEITQASIDNLPISANYDKQGNTLISLQDDISINQLTIGNTTLNETQLQALLALLGGS